MRSRINLRLIICHRFLQRNYEASNIVVPEFGTAVRQKWWSRLRNLRKNATSDNTMITVYPFNGSLYTFYESPHLHRQSLRIHATSMKSMMLKKIIKRDKQAINK